MDAGALSDDLTAEFRQSAMPRDTIAFISTYTHPSRDSIERTVREAFPEYRLENIKTADIIRAHREWIAPNLLFVGAEFGADILAKRASLSECYRRTTYLFRHLKTAMREVIDPARHVFSFQTQSMYDTSVPGVPHFLYTDHTHLSNLSSPYFDRRRLRSQKWIDLERTIYHNASRVFTRSSDITADVVNHYGVTPDHVACVRSGSNIHIPADFQPANDNYANKRILFVGSEWERKGGPELEQAFREVLKVHPDAHLTIAGVSPRLDLPNCTVLGKVPLQELTRHYAEASIFCLPTRLEPFGIVFIEAMLHRLPIVATRTGAVPDMVKQNETGLLVEPGDAKGLGRALIELVGDPARCRRYAETGYRHAREGYTWERVGQRMRENILPFLTSAQR